MGRAGDSHDNAMARHCSRGWSANRSLWLSPRSQARTCPWQYDGYLIGLSLEPAVQRREQGNLLRGPRTYPVDGFGDRIPLRVRWPPWIERDEPRGTSTRPG
jgi:hypothetical protein